MNKILITGNMGYIGARVVERLRRSYPNALLVGVDTAFFAHCLTNADIVPERITLDIQHYFDLRRPIPDRILEGVEGIVHLAAISNDPMGVRYEAVTHEINHRVSVRLAEQAKRLGCRRFVFASSCSVYGAAGSVPRTESSELNPLTAYAISKRNTEIGLKPLASDDFVVTCNRFPTACGMSERLRLDLVLNDFVASAVSTGVIRILSDGTPYRPLIDVDDMARAFDWGLCRDPKAGGNFLEINAGKNDSNYQIGQLAEAVCRVLPGATFSVNKNAEPDKRSYCVNFDLYARLAPDHQPQVSIDRSVRNLFAGLVRLGFADPDFRDSTYMRLNVLTWLRKMGRLSEDLEWIQPAA